MKQTITLFLWLCIPLFCFAQNPLPRVYEYDKAGNRIVRKVLEFKAPPAPPEDSLQVKSEQVDGWYTEKIAQVEMRIYPNPATEKITFVISGTVGTHGSASLQLYSLSGQLLQTQPLQSETTEISLSGLAKGAYILKVQVNGKTEEWKIVKQ
jgi:hypothetical protein